MLSVRDVARVLSVSEKTVRRLVHRDQGALPALRVGGSIRVDPVELEAWLFSDPALSPFGAGEPAARPAPGLAPAVEAEASAGERDV